MLSSILLSLSSLLLFYLGAKFLITGSTNVARTLRINPLMTGLTFTAVVSSAPLLTFSLTSALAGSGGMAMSSIIGSNIFNVCVIIGIIGLTTSSGVKIEKGKIAIPIAIVSTILLFFLFQDRLISRPEGLLLLLLWIAGIFLRIRFGRKDSINTEAKENQENKNPENQAWYLTFAWMLAGTILLIAGSKILILGFSEIAATLKIGSTIPGLTIIAAACSMPLLITSMMAVRKMEYEIALGNLIGANIFNILGVTGITSLIHPLSALSISNFDLYFLIGTSLILLQFFRPKYILKRDEGILLILLYAVYTYYLWPK